MPEETTEEKIAKSVGNQTEEYAKDLEDEADALIKQAYGGGEEDEGNTEEEQEADKGDNTQEDNDTSGDDVQDEGEIHRDQESDDDTDTQGSEDDLESLKADIARFQKQAKDNKREYTQGQQKLSEMTNRNKELEDVIFDLRLKMQNMNKSLDSNQNASDVVDESKSVAIDIENEIKNIEGVDPDLAKALSPVLKNILGQVKTLENQVKTTSDGFNKTALELAEDAHFGKIDKARPGWEDAMDSDEFADWKNTLSPRQRKNVEADLNHGSADDVIEIFSDFDNYQKSTQNNGNDTTTTRKKDKVNKAKDLANPKFNKSKDIKNENTSFKFTRSQIANMSPEEFEKNEKAIDEAMTNKEIDLLN